VSAGPRVVVALDLSDGAAALSLADRLSPDLCKLKVGKELFTAAGPGIVETLVRRRYGVFLDLKFHDIPNTVAQACRAAARLGVWMLNVHALGGSEMLRAGREALGHGTDRPLLVAVTILTSMGGADLQEIGLVGTAEEAAQRLAGLASGCGLDGVVCSAHEAAGIRERFGSRFLRVTPGIRLESSPVDDQKRVMTPTEAVAAGANYLVIGRPVTRAADPVAALQAISRAVESMETGQ
jgi:orotidine-5'-phosphate decarboxylase